MYFHPKLDWLMLLMMSYLVTIATDQQQTCPKICAKDERTAIENVRPGVNLFLLFVHVGQFYFPASLYYSGYVLTTGQNLVTRELLRT